MVSIEMWMAKIIGFMVLVRSHRLLKEFNASLWSDLQSLKDAIPMPRQKVSNFINEIEQGKVSDEEFVILERLVEKRSREAAQAQVTVTPVDTVQHCSPCPLNSDMPPDVCFKL